MSQLGSPLGAICRIPGVRSFRRRNRRHGLVFAAAVSLVLPLAVAALTSNTAAVVVSFVPLAIVSILLAAATYGLMDRPWQHLDERERHIRQTVFANPYMAGATVGIAAGTVAITAFNKETATWGAAAMSLWMLTFLLPTLLIAWTLPDEGPIDGEI